VLIAEHRRQARFCCLLNRMLFRAFAGGDRRNVLERFYQLPERVIGDFYALRLSTPDRLRILCGRPPRGFSV
jgi:lycopene beta-cyclase